LLNASVGVRRVVSRLRPTEARRSPAAHRIQRRSLAFASAARAPRLLTRPHLAGERVVTVTAVGLVALAIALSNLGTVAAGGPTGNTSGAGDEPRIALGGAVSGIENAPQGGSADQVDGNVSMDGDLSAPAVLSPDDRATIDGPFDADGTLVKPAAVDTTVADGAVLMRTYKVRSGDTLTGIARHFGVSMMTVWWANHLTSKNALHVGQSLLIPPVSGVVVKVAATDTLESIAARYEVDEADIIDANNLDDPNLVIGQTLTIPGARAAGIATPKPTKAPTPTRSTPRTVTHSGSGSSGRPPAQYTGGRFHWPVAGGYISQYFHYGHYALDIAADPGTKVMAAASGTVIFAGWKNNGGGYQVWIAHGSNLFTTYNHMSSITVGRGQSVSRAQQVGRVGMTGNATGPHLHFEVWRGPVWDGGTRVNPLIYL
jgi:murein DD-endopeptidase MepM/ murein hydrolase activator NlpD